MNNTFRGWADAIYLWKIYGSLMDILTKKENGYAQLHTYGVRSLRLLHTETRYESEEDKSPSLSCLATLYHPEWGEELSNE